MRPDIRTLRSRNKINHIIDLFRHNGELSKMRVRQLSGYSMSTVLAAFEQLEKDRMIVQTRVSDDEGRRGPKSTFYRLNATRQLYFGITFNQAGIYSAIVSFSGEVIATRSEPLELDLTRATFIARFRAHVRQMLSSHAEWAVAISTVALSLPGDSDTEQGGLRSYTFMPYLNHTNFRKLLKQLLPEKQCVVARNIAGFLSYLLLEPAIISKYRTIFFLSLRSGPASGIIHEGRIITPAGEIGHMQVAGNDQPCICGRTGCLDLLVSHQSLSEGMKKLLPKSHPLHGQAHLNVEDIVMLYRSGAAKYQTFLDDRFSLLANSLLDIANVLSPDAIVLSGQLFECFEDPVQKMIELARRRFADTGYIRNFSEAKMLYKSMGTETSAIGLCYQAIKKDFDFLIEKKDECKTN